MNQTELNEYANRYAKAWSSQDPESVAAFYSEGGSLSVNDEAPAVGREAIIEIARGFMKAFPDMEVRMNNVVSQSQGIVFSWTLTGTNTGPGGTGQQVRISGYELWQLGTDGRIVESKGRFDVAEYERQLEHGFDG